MSQVAVRPRAGLFWLLRPKIRTKLNRARTDEDVARLDPLSQISILGFEPTLALDA